MASVTVELPTLLFVATGGRPTITVEANTLAEALERLIDECPRLEVHLFDKDRQFREHVLCFHNETNLAWLEDFDIPVAEGDKITILQAVSGG